MHLPLPKLHLGFLSSHPADRDSGKRLLFPLPKKKISFPRQLARRNRLAGSTNSESNPPNQNADRPEELRTYGPTPANRETLSVKRARFSGTILSAVIVGCRRSCRASSLIPGSYSSEKMRSVT